MATSKNQFLADERRRQEENRKKAAAMGNQKSAEKKAAQAAKETAAKQKLKTAAAKAEETRKANSVSGMSKLDKKKAQSAKKATGRGAIASTKKPSTASKSVKKSSGGVKKSNVSTSTMKAAQKLEQAVAKGKSTTQTTYTTKRNVSGTGTGGTGSKRLSEAQQKVQADTVSSIKEKLKDVNAPVVRTADNYDANPYTKEKVAAMWDNIATDTGLSGTFGRAYTGAAKGFVDANLAAPSALASAITGQDINLQKAAGLTIPEEALPKLQKATAFNLGEFGGEMLAYGAQNVAAAPAINKLLAGTKLANGGFKSSMARNAIEAGTVGLAQNIGMASQQGLEGGDMAKDVLLNTGLDLVAGGVLESIPHVVDAVKNARAAKALQKSGVTLKGGKVLGEEVADNASKLATKSAKNATRGKKVGRVTTIQNPYEGVTPKQKRTSAPKTPEISKKTMSDVSYLTKNMDKNELKKSLKERFGNARVVEVDGLTMNGKPYHININKKTVGKIVSSKFSDENIAALDIIDDIVKNGEYVGSGKYIQHSNTKKDTIRFDYFETPIKIDGQEYVAKFDVEVFPDVNNYKAHDIKKIDLVPKTVADVGPEPTAAAFKSGLSVSVPDSTQKVKELPKSHNNKELKPGGADTLRPDMSVEEIAQRYGSFPGGEVPKRTREGDVMQGANTLHYAAMMDEKAQEAVREGVKAGDYWKTIRRNRDVMALAKSNVASDIDRTADKFFSVMKSGKQATSKDIATGYALAEEYINRGDYGMVENVLADVAAMESEAGRTLQAMRIFQSQTPAGRVKSALRTVQKLEESRNVKIDVDQKLLDKIMNAKTDAEKLAANKAFAENVWNQVPATLSEKLNAWRYLSMLGNPKTHIRNVLGNSLFIPARVLSDSISAGMEKVLGRKIARLSDGTRQGSKAIVGYTGSDKQLRKLAKSEYQAHRTVMEAASSKYFDTARPQDAKLYKLKAIEGLRKGNSGLLEKEDQIFMGINFESAFAQYCKANGKTADNMTAAFKKEAVDYAQRRALEATYRDPNRLAEALNRFKRNFKIKPEDTAAIKFGKAAGEIVTESILPFTKTPANILKRGVEYSPGGILTGMYKIATAKDLETLTKGIEYFSSGLTGTGLAVLGYYMAEAGYVNGSMGEYDKTVAYNQMLGDQDYAIHVGDYTYTVDWMAPLSMPFFVGVEVADNKESGLSVWENIEALSSITDPLFEMSMLSGIDNVFDTAFSSGSPLVNIGENAFQNYVSQYIPTLSGQIARTMTKDRKTTMSTAETKLERTTNKWVDKLTNKIPFATELNQPYVDQWGRRDSKKTAGDYFASAAENLLSPGYVSKRNETSVDNELQRLSKQLGETDAKKIIPAIDSSAYKVEFGGKEYRMTESEFTEYKETVGKARYSGLEQLFKTAEYKNASADEKRKMIQEVYEAGSEKGEENYIVGTGKATKEEYSYTLLSPTQQAAVDEKKTTAVKLRTAKEKAKAAGLSANSSGIELALALGGTDTATVQAYSNHVSDTAISEAQQLKNQGYTSSSWKAELEEAKSGYDSNGNGSLNKEEAMAYLSTKNYSSEKKWALLAAMTQVKKNPY